MKFIAILMFSMSITVVQAVEDFPFLSISSDFSFIALSGHRINYSKASDTMSVALPNGNVVASGKPHLMSSAFARKGYFQHGFSIYSKNEEKILEYAIILRTKLELPKDSNGAVDPRDFIDTRTLVSTSFWITDQVTEAEILNSSLFEGEAEISNAISIKISGVSCRGLLN